MVAHPTTRVDVYIETGKKRTFAAALDWPGWSRSGRDEASALQALLDHGPRYARAVRSARLGFRAPADLSALAIVERLEGDATTDFGAPGKAPASDARPLDEADLQRLQAVLRACWRTLAAAAQAAAGKELAKGPRGGGRELDAIIWHVINADASYVGRIGTRIKHDAAGDRQAVLRAEQRAMLEALAACARGEVPERGPRGGERWAPRTFARRAAWHLLDHTWEIEDRARD